MPYHQRSQTVATRFALVRGSFAGLVEPFGRVVEPVRRAPSGGSVNALGFGYLRLTFCGFHKLWLTLGGVLTERCTHAILLHFELADSSQRAHKVITEPRFRELAGVLHMETAVLVRDTRQMCQARIGWLQSVNH